MQNDRITKNPNPRQIKCRKIKLEEKKSIT